MNIWLKFAIIAVVAVVALVAITMITGESETAQTEPQGPQTYQEQIAEDEEKFGFEAVEKLKNQEPAADNNTAAKNDTPAAQTAPQIPQFTELTTEEEVQAQRLYEMAKESRKMGRLPAMGYGQMVNYCKQILDQFPGSVYAYQAKLLLADIPARYREQYKITDEMLDLNK